MVYLILEHYFPLNAPQPYEYIGPFLTGAEARRHQYLNGPRDAKVVVMKVTPDPVDTLSPLEHVHYLKGRG
jgi:hypothetical protein